MENCVFCKIVNGELPSYNIYEDEEFFAFLDIYPHSKGHVLLIPKKHYQWVYDVENFKEYWGKALTITNAVQKAMKPAYISYQTWGVQVPHAHIHIKPIYSLTENVSPLKEAPQKEEMEEIALKIKAAL